MSRFELPDLGEGLEEAQIVSWHARLGDAIVAGQPLVSVETAKAVVEIPSPFSGVVEKLGAEAGESVAVGALLADISDRQSAGIAQKPYTGIVGEFSESSSPGVEETVPQQAPQVSNSTQPERSSSTILATPAVRAAAAERGIELSDISGSGPGGSISADDLASITTERTKSSTESVPSHDRSMSARKRMATVMRTSGDLVVPASVTSEADVHEWSSGTDTTVRLIEAIVHACNTEPSLNAFFDDNSGTRKLQTSVDLGIAVESPDGLFVPVLRRAGESGVAARRGELNELIALSRNGGVSAQQMLNPTITLSNFGSLGGLFAQLVIVPPQVAIVGAGKIRPIVMPVKGEIQVRRSLPVSLTFDHRAVTGGEAVRFLNAFVESVEAGKNQTESVSVLEDIP